MNTRIRIDTVRPDLGAVGFRVIDEDGNTLINTACMNLTISAGTTVGSLNAACVDWINNNNPEWSWALEG